MYTKSKPQIHTIQGSPSLGRSSGPLATHLIGVWGNKLALSKRPQRTTQTGTRYKVHVTIKPSTIDMHELASSSKTWDDKVQV